MRLYSEKCLRNLQDRMIVFGFEGWDIFMVLGAALILQIVKVNSLVIWGICGVFSGFLILIKRGKPANASEHYMDWFFKDKRFTAIPQVFAHTIKGRDLDLKLTALQEILPYSHFEDGFCCRNPVPGPYGGLHFDLVEVVPERCHQGFG